MPEKRHLLILPVLILLLLLPFFGPADIQWSSILSGGDDAFIFWQLRVPRVLMGMLTGAVLALAGFLFQLIFKNSLATPFTLGVSSGASAGVVLGIKLQADTVLLGVASLHLFGFAGAVLAIIILVTITRMVRSTSIYTLLMGGVAINLFFSSFIIFLQYLLETSQTITVLRWLMGGISASGYRDVLILTPLAAGFLLFARLLHKELRIASAGDDFAYSRGLHIRRFRLLIFIIVSLVVGITVSVSGPIGFVGLMVPHIARLIYPARFKRALALTVVMGASFLAGADFLARMLIPPAEIPVGVITSLLGAPFFILVLVRQLRSRSG